MATKKQTTGARKAHGPKRNMFHSWSSTTRLHLAQAGILSKYVNRESWEQACFVRGKKNVTDSDWKAFSTLKTKTEKDTWLKALKA